MFKLNNVKALTKNQQKQINGGFGGDECSTVCYQHGDCCIYILNLPPPFGSIEQPGQCLGLRCVPN